MSQNWYIQTFAGEDRETAQKVQLTVSQHKNGAIPLRQPVQLNVTLSSCIPVSPSWTTELCLSSCVIGTQYVNISVVQNEAVKSGGS
jgi:hypothetical protein